MENKGLDSNCSYKQPKRKNKQIKKIKIQQNNRSEAMRQGGSGKKGD